jgi:hypothetical protein
MCLSWGCRRFRGLSFELGDAVKDGGYPSAQPAALALLDAQGLDVVVS